MNLKDECRYINVSSHAVLPYLFIQMSKLFLELLSLCTTKFHVANRSGSWEAVLSCCCCTSPLSPSGGASRSQWAAKRRTCCCPRWPTAPEMYVWSQRCRPTWSPSPLQNALKGICRAESTATSQPLFGTLVRACTQFVMGRLKMMFLLEGRFQGNCKT